MRLELNLDFAERFDPDRFLFGVAYAPYCEGAGLNTPDGCKNTDWAAGARGDRASLNFYDRYLEHVDLAASLGLNAFRMGI